MSPKMSSRRRSFHRSRNGCRCARRGCRESMSCRCPLRTKFAPGAANFAANLPMITIPRSGTGRCCSDWHRSALAAAKTTPRRRKRRAPRRWVPIGCRAGPCHARPRRARSRSRNMPSGPCLRAWISMAGRALCITRPNRINSTFRLSCADKRIDHRRSSTRPAVLRRASARARPAELTHCYN